MIASLVMPVFEHARRASRRALRALVSAGLAAVLVSSAGCSWLRTTLIPPVTNETAITELSADAIDPDGTPRAALRVEGSTGTTVASLRESLARDPDNVRGRLVLADLLVERGQLRQAGAALEEALAVDPHAEEALLLRGRVAELEQQDGLALECYHRVLGSDPENVVARLRIAELQIKAERPDRAAPRLAC